MAPESGDDMKYVPVSVRTYVTCGACGFVTAARFTQDRHANGLQLELPEGWGWGPKEGDGVIGEPDASDRLFCSLSCCFEGGYEDRRPRSGTFDPQTVDKIYELLDATTASPDNVLAAIEAVLIAWHKKAAA